MRNEKHEKHFDPFIRAARQLDTLRQAGNSWRAIARQVAPGEPAGSVAPLLHQFAAGQTTRLRAVNLILGEQWDRASVVYPVDGDAPIDVGPYIIVPAVRTCPASGLVFVQGKAILYSPFATPTQRRDHRRERVANV